MYAIRAIVILSLLASAQVNAQEMETYVWLKTPVISWNKQAGAIQYTLRAYRENTCQLEEWTVSSEQVCVDDVCSVNLDVPYGTYVISIKWLNVDATESEWYESTSEDVPWKLERVGGPEAPILARRIESMSFKL